MLGKKRPRLLAGLLSIFVLLQVLLMPISKAASTEDSQEIGTDLKITVPRHEKESDENLKRQFRYFKLDDLSDEDLLEIRDQLDKLSMDQVIERLGEEGQLTPESSYSYDEGKQIGQDTIILNKLEPGRYLFKETEESSSKFNYRIVSFIENIDSEQTADNQIFPKVILNKPQPLTLHKIGYDKEDDQKTIDLEGVKFNLLDKDGEVLNFIQEGDGVYSFTEDEESSIKDLVTDTNGRIKINKLASGDYTFREIETLEGFEIREADTDITYDRFQTNEKKVANYRPKEIKLHLHKTDGQTGDDLAGVGFRLYVKSGDTYTPVGIDEDGTYLSDNNIDYIFRTNEDGNIILDKLPELASEESYVFREVEPLDGYVSSDDILYTAKKDKVLEVKNYKDKNQLKLTKIDKVTKAPLDRVGFELFRKKVIDDDSDMTITTEDQRVGLTGQAGKYQFDEKAVESSQEFQLYTDGNGEITVENLPEGEYYFKENEPLEEYDIRDNLGMESEKLGRANPTYTMENLPKNPGVTPPDSSSKEKGSHNFVKVDNSKTPKRLEGALFAVYSVDEKGDPTPYEVDGKRLTIKSGSNGEFKVENLPFGKYQLRETAAPNGYVLDVDPIPFTISASSETNKAIFIVNKISPQVTPPGSKLTPKTPSNPPSTRRNVPPTVTPPSTTYHVAKDRPGIPRGPLVKTGDIRIIIFVALGLAMVIGGSHLVRKSEKSQGRLA